MILASYNFNYMNKNWGKYHLADAHVGYVKGSNFETEIFFPLTYHLALKSEVQQAVAWQKHAV